MRSTAVLLLIVLSVVIATALHAYKAGTHQSIDKLSKALSSAQTYLTGGTRISFHNEPLQHELLAQVRYIMAPVYIDVNTPAKYDTVLSIAAISDTSQQQYNTGRQIFWQYRDDTYTYILSSTK